VLDALSETVTDTELESCSDSEASDIEFDAEGATVDDVVAEADGDLCTDSEALMSRVRVTLSLLLDWTDADADGFTDTEYDRLIVRDADADRDVVSEKLLLTDGDAVSDDEIEVANEDEVVGVVECERRWIVTVGCLLKDGVTEADADEDTVLVAVAVRVSALLVVGSSETVLLGGVALTDTLIVPPLCPCEPEPVSDLEKVAVCSAESVSPLPLLLTVDDTESVFVNDVVGYEMLLVVVFPSVWLGVAATTSVAVSPESVTLSDGVFVLTEAVVSAESVFEAELSTVDDGEGVGWESLVDADGFSDLVSVDVRAVGVIESTTEALCDVDSDSVSVAGGVWVRDNEREDGVACSSTEMDALCDTVRLSVAVFVRVTKVLTVGPLLAVASNDRVMVTGVDGVSDIDQVALADVVSLPVCEKLRVISDDGDAPDIDGLSALLETDTDP
jgi:hypothetical protein